MLGNRFSLLQQAGHASITTLALLTLVLTASAGDQELAVPKKSAMQKADALVNELYAKELKQAKTDSVEKARLAEVFLQEGRDTKDYAAGRYVLFLRARDLAAEVGNVTTSLQAVEELGLSFDLKKPVLFTMKVEALTRAAQSLVGRDAYRNIADSALILLEDALEIDDFAAAGRLLKTAEMAGIKLRSVPVVSQIRQRKTDMMRLKKVYDKVHPFVVALKNTPADPKANLMVGRYHAYVRGNWKKGLPYLARADAPVSKTAKMELAKPAQPGRQKELAASWHALAPSLQSHEKTQVLLHAYHWFQEAEFQLKGADRKQVAQAMAAIMKSLPEGYRIGEIEREIRVLSGHSGPVFDVAFSPDGRKIASCGQDGVIIVWNAKTGKIIRRLSANSEPVWAVAFSPDGRRVLSGGFDSVVRLWDLASGRDIRRFEGHKDYVRDVAFSSDGKRIISCGDDRAILVWDAHSGGDPIPLAGHKHYVWSIAISRDGRVVGSASLDRTAAVWDLPAIGQPAITLPIAPRRALTAHTDTVLAVALSRDGRQLLSGGTDNAVRLFGTNTGKELMVLRGHTGFVTSVAFTPDGRRAISAGYDNTIRLWDLQTGKEIRMLEGHEDRIWSVVFSRDGRLAASAGHDGAVRIWGGKK